VLVRFLLTAASITVLGASTAQAALTITSKQTKNVSCGSGVCTAVSKHANLNADELVALLGSGDVRVATGSKAKDIEVSVTGDLIWNSAHHLALDSFRSLTVTKVLFYKGTGGGLDLKANDGGTDGTLNFGDKGHIAFINSNTATLTINGANYVLIPNVHALSSAISMNPSGNFALYGPINAGVDGTYLTDPVTTIFQGHLEGLGNTIQHLRINVKTTSATVGLFYGIDGGTITHFKLAGAKVHGGKSSEVGTLAGFCKGAIGDVEISTQVQGGLDSLIGGVCGVLDATLGNVHVSGTATGDGGRTPNLGSVGGLVGSELGGTITDSSAAVHVAGGKGWAGGGFVGKNQGAIELSFATGVVVVGDDGVSGGLVGSNTGTVITNSYATGTTQGGIGSTVGGFIGLNNGPVSASYSAGPVASGSGNAVGGFIGDDQGAADLANTYFDTKTSGQSHGVGNNTA